MVWQFWGRAARGVLSVFAQGAFSCLAARDMPCRNPEPSGSNTYITGSDPAHDGFFIATEGLLPFDGLGWALSM